MNSYSTVDTYVYGRLVGMFDYRGDESANKSNRKFLSQQINSKKLYAINSLN